MRFSPRLSSTVLLLALTAGSLGSGTASAVNDSETPTKPVVVDVVTANGSGCPSGTSKAVMGPDNKSLVIQYSEYVALAGPKVSAKENRKACQVSLDVKVPHGYSYGISKAKHRGYAKLDEGATGKQLSTYYFQGSSADTKVKADLKGPHRGDFVIDETVPEEDIVWTPCTETRYLNAKTEIRVGKGTSDEESTMTFTDSDYTITWRRCS